MMDPLIVTALSHRPYITGGALDEHTTRAGAIASALALGRKNALFAGSDGGARHWAIVASLVATAN